MREIKFRAWDTANKIMIDEVLSISWSEKSIFYKKDGLIYSQHMDYIILMQYTGLKDKKRTGVHPAGQEIYAGDKLQGFNDCCVVYWKQSHAGFYCKWGDGSDMPLNCGVSVSKCEIIDNTTDNPELLK